MSETVNPTKEELEAKAAEELAAHVAKITADEVAAQATTDIEFPEYAKK